ncbi:MAG TPA: NCS2 family permease [Clostridia bacterium]
MSTFKNALDKFWGISKRGSNFPREIIAGVTTFLTMAYIITVNPGILSTGRVEMYESLYIATILGAALATLFMAFYAKAPYAQAPGMGLNAFVAYTLTATVAAGGFGLSYGVALNIICIGGLLCVLLSITKLREKILNAVPETIRTAIPVGIGLFIAFVGMQNAKLIIGGATLVDLADFTVADCLPAVVCLIGFLTIAILSKLNVKGAILIGIIFATVVGIPMGVTKWNEFGTSWLPAFDKFFSGDVAVSGAAAFWKSWGDFGRLFSSFSNVVGVLVIILSLAMIDLFDTFGTLLGTAKTANLIDEDGKIERFSQTLMADSVATVFGSMLGTSNVTTYVESASGISVGGRTGLTALVVALLFILALFLAPLFSSIPSAAAASALIYVGVLMMSNVKDIDFSDAAEAAPAFLTFITMPLAYSITDGIGIGILSYVVIKFFVWLVNIIKYACNKEKYEKPAWEIHPVTAVIAVLFVLYFVLPVNLHVA